MMATYADKERPAPETFKLTKIHGQGNDWTLIYATGKKR
jgi:hypothetical protein